MEINHNTQIHKVWIEQEGCTAYVEYELTSDSLDIKHTIVPTPIEGQGIASQLVKYVYDYALQQGLKPAATCSYAQVWLKRHLEYNK